MPDSRIFHLPYTYRVEGIRSGHRNPGLYHFLDDIPVRIPLLSSAEVPAGLVVRPASGNGPVREYRAYNGRPVRPFEGPRIGSPYDDPSPTDPDNLEMTLRLLADPGLVRVWPDYPLPFGKDGPLPPPVLDARSPHIAPPAMLPSVRRGEGDMREILHDFHEEDRAAAAASADSLVFVDGVLHREVPEPCWRLAPADPARRKGPVLALGDPPPSRLIPGMHCFRADRARQANMFLQVMADRAGLPATVDSVAEDSGLIYWRLDDTRQSMADLGQWLLGAMSAELADQMRWMPRPFFDAFCDIRDAVEAEVPDAEAFAGYLSALRDSLAAGVPPRGRKLAESLAGYLDPAIWRYTELERLAAEGPAHDEDTDAVAAAFRP